MKKIIVLLVVAVVALIVSLSACGGSENSESPAERLEQMWIDMSTKEKADLCIGFYFMGEDELSDWAKAEIQDSPGNTSTDDDVDEMIDFIKEICD